MESNSSTEEPKQKKQKQEMESSSPSSSDPLPLPPAAPHAAPADSPFSLLLFDIMQQAQGGLENMMKIVGEVEQSASGIEEEIEKCKVSAAERKSNLEAEKNRFQKAALAMLEMLDSEDRFDVP